MRDLFAVKQSLCGGWRGQWGGGGGVREGNEVSVDRTQEAANAMQCRHTGIPTFHIHTFGRSDMHMYMRKGSGIFLENREKPAATWD